MKLLKPAATFLRQQGLCIVVYIPGHVANGRFPREDPGTKILVETLESLGFVLNTKKCILHPQQIIELRDPQDSEGEPSHDEQRASNRKRACSLDRSLLNMCSSSPSSTLLPSTQKPHITRLQLPCTFGQGGIGGSPVLDPHSSSLQ